MIFLLNLKGNECQRVRPAKSVFSRTTPKEVLNDNKKDSSDVMNSNSTYPHNSHDMKANFGVSKFVYKQKEVLNETKPVTSTMRMKGKLNLLSFQKGTIISINSLFGLLDYEQQPFDLRYIMTTCLTQDV